MQTAASRMVVVSNRLPVSLSQTSEGGWSVKPGSGGLVTALGPILKDKGGLWIGWSGAAATPDACQLIEAASGEAGYQLRSVALSEKEFVGYYCGFSNEIIWPLFHDLQTRCNFEPTYWYEYLQVNRKFAEVVASHTEENDFVWVHDYHLMHVAKALKALDARRKVVFFLHIPFPPLEIFMKLPWRTQILEALLDYELVGFQTLRDRRHFVQCVQHFFPHAKVLGRGPVVSVHVAGREVKVGAFAISIDYAGFVRDAESKEVADSAWYLHEALPERQVVLGIDRLDYTKGIPERLEAIRHLLATFPDLREKISFVQVVVPSREGVTEYQGLKTQIESLVSEINGEFTVSGWIPIHYMYRSLDRWELLAYYRLSDIALITPLKDGMNLVAKEYCACNIEENGVLILSEFAGAAAQLGRDAIIVNPYDVEGVANAIHEAVDLDHTQRRERMHRLRESIKRRDIFWWVRNFLEISESR